MTKPTTQKEKLSLEELIARREEAVAAFDFMRAKKLEKRISNLSKETLETQTDQFTEQFIQNANDEIEGRESLEKDVLSRHFSRVIRAKRAYNEQLSELQQRHLEALTLMHIDLETKYHNIMVVPLTKYDELTERAKQNARNGAFDVARDLHATAEQYKEKELESRDKKTREMYEQALDALLAQQTSELQSFMPTLEVKLAALDNTMRQEIQALDSSLIRKITGHYQFHRKQLQQKYDPRKIETTSQQLDNETRTRYLKNLKAAYHSFVQSINPSEEDTKPSAPSTPQPSRQPSRTSSRLNNRQ